MHIFLYLMYTQWGQLNFMSVFSIIINNCTCGAYIAAQSAIIAFCPVKVLIMSQIHRKKMIGTDVIAAAAGNTLFLDKIDPQQPVFAEKRQPSPRWTQLAAARS